MNKMIGQLLDDLANFDKIVQVTITFSYDTSQSIKELSINTRNGTKIAKVKFWRYENYEPVIRICDESYSFRLNVLFELTRILENFAQTYFELIQENKKND